MNVITFSDNTIKYVNIRKIPSKTKNAFRRSKNAPKVKIVIKL